MKGIALSMNELYKYQVIKKMVETNGNKNSAALKLNCSRRTIDRLIIKYKKQGKAGFIHGNRGRRPGIAIHPDLKQKIVDLYLDSYGDTNLTHYAEIVLLDFGISISPTTLNNWLREVNQISPKAHKKTRRALKKKLAQALTESSSVKVKNQLTSAIEQLDRDLAHPRRPRCKFMGEMIQMDASSFEFVPGQIWHLHLAVDDATGTVVGAYFDWQETLNGYYHVFHQILTHYGIPAMFYTDRRTVFEYRKKKDTASDALDTFTQFAFACHQLGVDIKTTSVAQAKGRIERLNQSFQSRLPVELRRANIQSLEQANLFLSRYLIQYNDQFALRFHDSKSVFEKQPDSEIINRTLAVIQQRTIDKGHCIQFKKHFYRPIDIQGEPVYLLPKTQVYIIQAFDNSLYLNLNDVLYCLCEIPSHQAHSKEFDPPVPEIKPKKKYIPPQSHPWRKAAISRHFNSFDSRSASF